MKHSQSIKIFAALTAAPRWAIALMPADGAMFPWSSEPWFEIASGLLSLAFAVVEIWATSFIMQAWHEAQATGDINLARNLRRLWVTTLVVLAAALVPPMFANVMRVNVNTFNPWLLGAWLTCVAASTFLVIGGVGYADRAQPAAQDLSIDLRGLQVPSTGETDAPNSVTGDDTGYNASQSRQNGTSSDFGMKPDALGVEELSEAPSAVMELDTIEARLAQVQLTGKYTVDMVNCLLAVPEAKPAQLASYIGCSRQHVDNTIKRWEQDKKISKNGQVKFIEPVNN